MPPLYGYRKEWEEYPDWLYRYDFVVKQPPPVAPGRRGRPHVSAIPYEPSAVVAHYHEYPATGFFGRQKRRGPVFFTSFLWRDEAGALCTVTRAELCAAFRRLVKTWQHMVALLEDQVVAIGHKPFKDGRKPTADASNALEAYLTEGRGAAYCPLITQYDDVMSKTLWAAEYFGQYLAFLSDLEDRGEFPLKWERYPGVIDEITTRLKSTSRHKIMINEGVTEMTGGMNFARTTAKNAVWTDDYPLRAAGLLIVGRDTPGAVDEVVRDAKAHIAKGLHFKGYSASEIEAFVARASRRKQTRFLSPSRRWWNLLPPSSSVIEKGGMLDPVYEEPPWTEPPPYSSVRKIECPQ